jgi:hypothetical protein
VAKLSYLPSKQEAPLTAPLQVLLRLLLLLLDIDGMEASSCRALLSISEKMPEPASNGEGVCTTIT